jgi:hypothetical protein
MRRRFEIQIGSEQVTAEMLDNEAPRTCEAFWNSLPMESDLHHAKYAGAQIYFMCPRPILDEWPPVEGKVQVWQGNAGQVCWYQPKQFIAILYGELEHEEVDVSVFAKIIEQDLSKLRMIGRKCWLNPGNKVVVRKTKERQ